MRNLTLYNGTVWENADFRILVTQNTDKNVFILKNPDSDTTVKNPEYSKSGLSRLQTLVGLVVIARMEKWGSSGIGSALMKWVENLPVEDRKKSFFSERFVHSNKKILTSIDIIEHKFLESGHSWNQNNNEECHNPRSCV